MHIQEQLILRTLERAGSWLSTFGESSGCEDRVLIPGSWVGMVTICNPSAREEETRFLEHLAS